MTENERILHIIEELKAAYGEADCSLDYEKDYELLFSVRLAAQCTDARVNIVTKELYKKFKSLEDFSRASIGDMEEMVRPCGFYKVKAKDLIEMSRVLLEKHGGKVPGTMEELLALPGVGRKTANLILGDIYGMPAIVADTHCIRVSNLLGLANSKDPFKVEMQLKGKIPPEDSNFFCHALVLHGRAVCVARRPKCDICSLYPYCAAGSEQ